MVDNSKQPKAFYEVASAIVKFIEASDNLKVPNKFANEALEPQKMRTTSKERNEVNANRA